jgi:acyl-CoA synthetase (AMP-forming)/AMP-acid ligase II
MRFKKIQDVFLKFEQNCEDVWFIEDESSQISQKKFLKNVEMYRNQIRELTPTINILPFFPTRSSRTIEFIYACVMEGVAFSPISKEQPTERIISCLNSLGQDSIFEIDNWKIEKNLFSETQPNTVILPDDLLYILFTSGSTGTPKGVMISESGLFNTMAWSSEEIQLSREDVIGIATNFYFDISIFDIFSIFFFHNSAIVLDLVSGMDKLSSKIIEKSVTRIFSTPSFFEGLDRFGFFTKYNSLNNFKVISGGDFLASDFAEKILNQNQRIEIYNVWGPTETTIVNSAQRIELQSVKNESVQNLLPIGRSTKLMPIEILDLGSETMITEDNKMGELIVFGESVGLGYVNSESMAKDRYCKIQGRRAFRTGDLGFRKGELLYISGRSSMLIKYGGYRIDPREIEFHANLFPGTLRSVFTLNSDDNGIEWTSLVCEVTDMTEVTIQSIKRYLKQKLPPYMVPKQIIPTTENLLTDNGKLNRIQAKKISDGYRF